MTVLDESPREIYKGHAVFPCFFVSLILKKLKQKKIRIQKEHGLEDSFKKTKL